MSGHPTPIQIVASAEDVLSRVESFLHGFGAAGNGLGADVAAALAGMPSVRAELARKMAVDQRPEGFVEMRRQVCSNPNLCFRLYGDATPVCAVCDVIVVEALEKARMAAVVMDRIDRATHG